MVRIQGQEGGHVVSFNGGSAVATTGLNNSNGSDARDLLAIDSDIALGNNTIKTLVKQAGYAFQGYDLVTPIHTSHHYQTFETPYLHELVGGDRNMEQTNLVCSPDGKTWDEVTRNTSYIGNHVLNTVGDIGSDDSNAINIFENWRGQTDASNNNLLKPNWIKDSFVPAYDRVICLKDGSYQIMAKTYEGAGGTSSILINGTLVAEHFQDAGSAPNILHTYLKRGDYIQIRGQFYNTNFNYNQYSIVKI